MSSEHANAKDSRRQAHDLRFFVTMPHRCSYLPGREATTLFLDPEETPTPEVYDTLTLMGFRRSGGNLYRPHCETCNACLSVRIPVEAFTPSRTQRKLRNRNSDLELQVRSAEFDEEHYALYARYIEQRHGDGDMSPPSREQYRMFLTQAYPFSQLLEFRCEGALLAVAATDMLGYGMSAIYTFFDPDPALERRSLGAFAILSQIELARQQKMPHVYLGYWIQACQKMRYKQDYQPLEYFQNGRWQRMIAANSAESL